MGIKFVFVIQLMINTTKKKALNILLLKGISSSITTNDKLPTINKLEMQQSKIFVIGLSTSESNH